MRAEGMIRPAITALWFGVLLQALVACSPIGAGAGPSVAVSYGPPVNLAVNGFNYTDLPIDHFSVGGAGGDIVVSSQTSGGGKTSCCLSWRPGTKLPIPIKVEWMRYVNDQQRWCEKTVQLTGPAPDNPSDFDVHFMPDGEIQVEITRGHSAPKLRLTRFSAGQRKETGNVIHDEETARCRDAR